VDKKNKTMKFKFLKVAVAALLVLLAVSCGQQPAVPEFQTIEVEDFVKHPKGTDDYQRLTYKVSFTYPSRYANKAVLKKLQQRFVQTMHASFQNPDNAPAGDYASLSPEKAVIAIIETWKARYIKELNEEVPERASVWELKYDNAIPFVNETLLQLQTEFFGHLGGAHGYTSFTCHLFNLQSGEEYKRDDIFKPEAADRIQLLLLTALLNFWEMKSSRESGLIVEKILTENTNFAVTPEGIAFVYSDNELGSYYAFGIAQLTVPYDEIFPYLREGTPVWDVAAKKTGMADNQNDGADAMEARISKDILALPEMQFPHAAVVTVSAPTAGQPYYEVRGGSNTDGHFATSFWFHVYVRPTYEIKVYDIVTDTEITLQEWRLGATMTMTTTNENDEFRFVLLGTGTATVDWGDGSEKETYEILEYTDFVHEFSDTNPRTVTVSGKNIIYFGCICGRFNTIGCER
jgi:hypothetical protein